MLQLCACDCDLIMVDECLTCVRLSLLMKLTVCLDDLGKVKVENQEIQTEVVETVEQYVQAEDTTQGV